ncbi:hypothetical protein [Mycobacterium intracellulare]|uniref:Uncharacterized protein n=1 Tax=Mycobacterium intracellulare subsp. chimaera TaxID=222805 RepID=A0ABT7P7N1_MYCIT|nr:hypothetical protein [Mycobacterium intracellulare]MDM3929275.1 hypothetical protein [Mycobacterium intracellulare subsp. chimaera]
MSGGKGFERVSGSDRAQQVVYAAGRAAVAIRRAELADGQIGDGPGYSDCEYGIEMAPGASVLTSDIEELTDAIGQLPEIGSTAAIVVRDVTFGPWRYVTPEAIAVESDPDDETV